MENQNEKRKLKGGKVVSKKNRGRDESSEKEVYYSKTSGKSPDVTILRLKLNYINTKAQTERSIKNTEPA